MKLKSKKSIFFLTSLIILICFFELSSYILIKNNSPAPVKTYHSYYQDFNKSQKSSDHLTMKAHPYFGATYSQSSNYIDPITGKLFSRSVNNYGFISQVDYPYTKTNEEITLAIFGGSVADQFSNFFENHPLKNKLENILQKKIRILNMAVGSMKQPQQFFISSYFLETIDYSINIDGFNEITTNQYPFKPIEYPAFDLGTVSNDNMTITSLFLHNLNRKFLKSFTQLISIPILRSSNMIFLLWSTSALNFKKNIEQSYKDLEKLSSHLLKKSANQVSENEILSLETQAWLKYTKLQSQLYRSNGIKGFFFLQPNLRVDSSKKFSVIENKFRNQNYKNFKISITERYDYLSKKIKYYNLKNTIPIHNLTNLFINNEETLYVDHCCHLNKKGNEIMAHEIIKTIQASL
jgi:hypothetical protein